MRLILTRVLFATVAFFWAALALAQDVDAGTIGEKVSEAITAAQAGQWAALAACVIWALVWLLKQPWLGGLLLKIPKRVRPFIPLVLGVAFAAVTAAAGGVPWDQAIVLALSGPMAVGGNEIIYKGAAGRGTKPPA